VELFRQRSQKFLNLQLEGSSPTHIFPQSALLDV
jgi:hypothetical protein